MFFQHLSHMTPPPSTWIHRPSSIVFSHLRHERTRGARRFDSGRAEPSPGLVCARVGSLGRMLSRWLSCASAIGKTAGLETDDAVGEVASSSKSVSIARSSAPVDLAAVRTVYEDVVVDVERLRAGSRGDGAAEDDAEEYLDSDFIDSRMEGNRTPRGCTVDCRTVPSLSSSSESSAYASPSNSDSSGDSGELSAGDFFASAPARLDVSTGVTFLFLNFSKKGSDGVEGVAGKGAFGGSTAGGMTRSRKTSPRSRGEGVRAMAGCVGVIRPSLGDGIVAECGEPPERGEWGEVVEPAESGGVPEGSANRRLAWHKA